MSAPKRTKLGLLGTLGILLGAAAGPGLDAPAAVSPRGDAGTAAVAAPCPTFHWGGVEDARSYELVIYRLPRAAGGEPRVAVRTVLPGSARGWTPSLDGCLEAGGGYAWSLRALPKRGRPGPWSEPEVFRVAAPPPVTEVEEALAVLRRYVETGGVGRDPAAGGGAAADPAPATAGGERPAESREPLLRDPEDERSAAAVKRRSGADRRASSPGPGAPAPALGTASLVVDQQIQLGMDSAIFKDGKVFLWSDDDNTALGHGALRSNDTGDFNTAVGSEALDGNTTGDFNSALGRDALHENTEGQNNTAMGDWALHDNTTGDDNTALGVDALVRNEVGSENTAVGVEALRFNTASRNTGLGFKALEENTTGARNTAIGWHALRGYYKGSPAPPATGRHNTAVGAGALEYNRRGGGNTGVGYQALKDNESGAYNVAVGGFALEENESGTGNTAVGQRALRRSTTHASTAVGRDALGSNTTGSFNTAVGYGALLTTETADSSTAVGHKALNKATNNSNTAVGSLALSNATTGVFNVAIGADAGVDMIGGSENIFIDNRGQAGDTQRIRIGVQGVHKMTYIAGISTHAFNSYVGVAPTGLLFSTGVPAVSSRRFKDHIEDIGDASRRLLELRPVEFRFKEGLGVDVDEVHFGLIAEEVAELFPELVDYDEEGRPYAVRYRMLSSLLLNELQREHGVNAVQDEKLGEQAAALKQLRRRLRELEAEQSRPLADRARGTPAARRR